MSAVPYPSPSPAPPAVPDERPPANVAALLFTAIAVGAVVLWMKGKSAERRERAELHQAMEDAERAQKELDAHREDLVIAHDWRTDHPLSVRYGQ